MAFWLRLGATYLPAFSLEPLRRGKRPQRREDHVLSRFVPQLFRAVEFRVLQVSFGSDGRNSSRSPHGIMTGAGRPCAFTGKRHNDARSAVATRHVLTCRAT